MVIFHSYVSLPEGSSSYHPHQIVLIPRHFLDKKNKKKLSRGEAPRSATATACFCPVGSPVFVGLKDD